MNGLTLLTLIALAIGIVVAYRAGIIRGRREARSVAPPRFASASTPAPAPAPAPKATPAAPPALLVPSNDDGIAAEKARLIRSYEAHAARLERALVTSEAHRSHLATLADDRRALLHSLADARAETARYRQIVVDIENNAPPVLLDVPGAPDDLKLIVGVGPVLERMLHQLGIGTYRQIARWSERDIDDFDAKLPEFQGRIRRDGWVTQARALHLSKYGEPPPAR